MLVRMLVFRAVMIAIWIGGHDAAPRLTNAIDC